jgi:hypothetical protein
VLVDGLRTKKESASGYGNRLRTSGTTNDNGIANVKYPRYVLEEMETGHLILTVTHPEYSPQNLQSYDYTTIAADGTFEFESIPHDADIQLSAISDGWVSVSAEPASVLERFPYITTPEHAEHTHNTMTVSQSFPRETQQPLLLEMEQTATCNFLVVDAVDRPVAGAQIVMSPNTANAGGLGGTVGSYFRTATTLEIPKADRKVETPDAKRFRMRFNATTDSEGRATIKSVPPLRGIGVDVYHPKFEMPSGERGEFHRGTRVQLAPGEIQDVTLRVEAKGAHVLGR